MSEMDKLQVGVIFGGRSGEHEVSLVSARSVLKALNPDRYQVTEIGITREGVWFVGEKALDALEGGGLEKLHQAALLPLPGKTVIYTLQAGDTSYHLERLVSLDVIFPVLHGTFGEDGTLQGLLEMAGAAYVGAGVLGSSVGMDKALFKDVMRANQIPVVDSILVLRSDLENDFASQLNRAEQLAPFPLFVKPANMGSSVGVHKCRNRVELEQGLRDAARYDRRILVEEGINAREIEISVLGNEYPRASIPGEIRPTAEFYSYEAKYHDDSSELLIPAPLTRQEIEHLQDVAIQAYKVVDCAGMARVDFLKDRVSGKVYLNELNTIPGFTPISMYPKLWDASGLAYPDLIDELIHLALRRRAQRENTTWSFDRSREQQAESGPKNGKRTNN